MTVDPSDNGSSKPSPVVIDEPPSSPILPTSEPSTPNPSLPPSEKPSSGGFFFHLSFKRRGGSESHQLQQLRQSQPSQSLPESSPEEVRPTPAPPPSPQLLRSSRAQDRCDRSLQKTEAENEEAARRALSLQREITQNSIRLQDETERKRLRKEEQSIQMGIRRQWEEQQERFILERRKREDRSSNGSRTVMNANTEVVDDLEDRRSRLSKLRSAMGVPSIQGNKMCTVGGTEYGFDPQAGLLRGGRAGGVAVDRQQACNTVGIASGVRGWAPAAGRSAALESRDGAGDGAGNGAKTRGRGRGRGGEVMSEDNNAIGQADRNRKNDRQWGIEAGTPGVNSICGLGSLGSDLHHPVRRYR